MSNSPPAMQTAASQCRTPPSVRGFNDVRIVFLPMACLMSVAPLRPTYTIDSHATPFDDPIRVDHKE
jgi:hypothetical protein